MISPRTVAIAIILGLMGVGTLLGLCARGRHRTDLEQWTVGGRGFGLLFVVLLMAGEVYTTFTFLGAAGWAYSRGGPALYILAFCPLVQVGSYHISPRLWRLGRDHGLQTQADFFAHCYGGQLLPVVVALIGLAAIIPYLELQLTGLGIIVRIASFGGIARSTAIILAGISIGAFVLVSGIRGVAAVSLLKDFLMLGAIAVAGIGVPYVHFGGIAPMFARLAREHPAHLVMPGSTANLGHLWFVSTVMICALGPMFPHVFAAAYTARSAEILRRNSILLPLYNLSVGFVFMVGFGALLLYPALANGDLAFLTAVRATFPAWVLGIIGGAGALTAMVPAAVLALTASTLLAKNVVRPLLAPGASEAHVRRLARFFVIVLVATSCSLALANSKSLVALLLLGYDAVSQFFPGVVLGLCRAKIAVSRSGLLAALVAGETINTFLVLAQHDPCFGVNAGLIGLGANVTIVGVCVLASRLKSAEAVAAALAAPVIPED